MSSLLTQIENVTADRKAAAQTAYDEALAAAAIDPDVVAYLETLEQAAAGSPSTKADVARLERVLDRLGRTVADFRHDVGVRQQVAKLRATLLTEEAEAALDAERQAVEDRCEKALRKMGHDMIDQIPASDLAPALYHMNLQAVQTCRGYDGTAIHHGIAPAVSRRDNETRDIKARIERRGRWGTNQTAADQLESANPRAFPPAV